MTVCVRSFRGTVSWSSCIGTSGNGLTRSYKQQGDKMEWRKDKAPHSIGEVLFLGPWNVGGVHYDSLSSKDDVMKYVATCKLPGVKWPGKFQTVKEAKAAVEYSVKHWLSRLPK
jgi:hypothetical protein